MDTSPQIFKPNVLRPKGWDILSNLHAKERALIFIDESGTPGKPLNLWARDYHVYVALVMQASDYSQVIEKIATRFSLAELNVSEFHAKEIVNPNESSTWRMVSVEKRMEAIVLLTEMCCGHALEIPFMELSGEQYETEFWKRLPDSHQGFRTKEALELCFYNSLLPHVRSRHPEIALVADSVEDAAGVLRIKSAADPTGIYEGGLIEADSRYVLGVQLVDFAAYLFNRRPHLQSRLSESKVGQMDELMRESWRMMKHLYVNLLEED